MHNCLKLVVYNLMMSCLHSSHRAVFQIAFKSVFLDMSISSLAFSRKHKGDADPFLSPACLVPYSLKLWKILLKPAQHASYPFNPLFNLAWLQSLQRGEQREAAGETVGKSRFSVAGKAVGRGAMLWIQSPLTHLSRDVCASDDFCK